MQNIFYYNLQNSNLDLIVSFINQENLFQLNSIGDKNEFVDLAKSLQLQYLILDGSFAEADFNQLKVKLGGSLLNSSILCVVNTNEENTQYDFLKNFTDRVLFLQTDLSLVKKASVIFDFLNNPNKTIKKEESLVPLDSIHISNFKTAPSDIHLKLSDKKFVKIINKGDETISDVLKKYDDKNIKEFFVPLNSISKFKEELIKNLFLIDKKANPADEQLRITDSVIALAKDFGLSDFVIEGINKTFEDIDKEMNSNEKLKSLLVKISSNNGSLLGNHSYLTAVFITLIGQKFPWFKGEIRKNLFIAAVLHDLELTKSGFEIYEYKNLEEINKLKLSDRNFVKKHATLLAEKLGKIDVIPSDVVNIIAKHHEGAGPDLSFPFGLNSPQLSPPNCLFNVAHQIAIEFSNVGFNQSKIKSALESVKQIYTGNNFKAYIESFESQTISLTD